MPTHAPAGDERQRPADRQADAPVADEVPDHRPPRLAQAAQGAGRDHLHAVEDREDRADAEQPGAGADHVGVAREHADQEPRQQHEERAPWSPSPSMPIRIAAQPACSAPGPSRAADGVADAHRRRRGDAERDHEGQAGELERHLVRGDRRRPLAGRHRGRQREDADLEHHLQHRRHAEAQQRRERRRIELPARRATPACPGWCRRSYQTIAASGTTAIAIRADERRPGGAVGAERGQARGARRSAPSCRSR